MNDRIREQAARLKDAARLVADAAGLIESSERRVHAEHALQGAERATGLVLERLDAIRNELVAAARGEAA